jgi:hypothetical protein
MGRMLQIRLLVEKLVVIQREQPVALTIQIIQAYILEPVKILEHERVLIQTTHSTVHVISTIKVLVPVNVIELDLLS